MPNSAQVAEIIWTHASQLDEGSLGPDRYSEAAAAIVRLFEARLAALTRENEALRTDRELQRGYIADVRAEIAAERARAEKARGDAVARVPSVDEMLHAFDEKQGKLDDPFRRNLWLAELAAVRDLVLRALAHDEGRGTPERKEP